MFRPLAAVRKALAVSHSPSRSCRKPLLTYRPQLESLEKRALPTHVITPLSGLNLVGVNPGNTVTFRKGPSGFIQESEDNISSAQQLMALSLNSKSVIAAATDNGVRTINYQDSGGGNDFLPARDVGIGPPANGGGGEFARAQAGFIGPLTPVKTTGPAGGPNSGTFNTLAEDDEFAMVSSGFIYIPSPGAWTFSIKSDDGARLTMGTNNAVVTEFSTGRPAAYGNNLDDGNPGQAGATDSVAIVPRAGFYPYHLLYWEGGGLAMVQLTAVKGAQPEPTDGTVGFLPQGSHLVGDTANGGLAVFQNVAAATHHGRRNG
jgi:hypothetical protein